MTQSTTLDQLREGLRAESSDGQKIGEVAEVWRDVGVGESWGAVGSIPQEGAEAADPSEFAFSEAMPGEGSDYFRVRKSNGSDLYVPMGVLTEVRGDVAVLGISADDVPAMQWDVIPDFVNVTSASDSGAPSTQA